MESHVVRECPQCHAPVSPVDVARFCTECGGAIADAAPSSRPAVQIPDSVKSGSAVQRPEYACVAAGRAEQRDSLDDSAPSVADPVPRAPSATATTSKDYRNDKPTDQGAASDREAKKDSQTDEVPSNQTHLNLDLNV